MNIDSEIEDFVSDADSFFKPAWISLAILRQPITDGKTIHKGALILNQVDPILRLFPILKTFFFIIERRGWHGPNDHKQADIKLVEDLTTWEFTLKNFPQSILIDMGPADFVDHHKFKPIEMAPEYDVIQVSCWSRRKRIELLIQAAAKLPHRSFVHFGHFEDNGTESELAYRDYCLALAASIAPNVHFPFAHCNKNEQLPNTKEEMNIWLNRAKLGVLTTQSEGINRFKMECLSANKPCLLPRDISPTTLKHINTKTGSLYNPSDEHLADSIEKCLTQLDNFAPRAYILEHTGKDISLQKLKRALNSASIKANQKYIFDEIDWDGRNESLKWGDDALEALKQLSAKYSDAQ